MSNTKKAKPKRLLSLFLVLVLVLGMLPAMSLTASAAEMTYIQHVDIQMDAPKAGMTVSEYAATIGVDNKHELSYNNLVVDELYCYRVDDSSFDKVGTDVSSFEEGGVYVCYVDIVMNDDDGYQFEHNYSEMTVLVNGQTLDNYDYDRENGDVAGFEHDSYTLTYTLYFTATGGEISGTTGAGTESDPVICTTFAEFKAAMESTTVTYVKLNGVSGIDGKMHKQETLAAAISNTTYKVLTIEGMNTFYSPLSGMNDCLIWPRADLMINGTGTLEYQHGNTGGSGAVINNMSSGVLLTINDNVTLKGNANGTAFGGAIKAYAGTTIINGGSFIGYSALNNDYTDIEAVLIGNSANVTINGGSFSASFYDDAGSKKAYGLAIPNTATGAISIKAGTFSQGIDIGATGKTIETCGYFDTAKASITTGGNPVEATASTDVLKSTEVIVTDTSVIGSVTVAVTTPVAGATPAAPSSGTANVTVSNYMWTIQPEGKGISSFEGGKTYRCTVLLNPASGYTFKSGTTVTIGGQTATIDSQSATGIQAHYDFTTPAVPVSSLAISVTAPAAGDKQAAPTTSTANVSIAGYQWKLGGNPLAADATFEAGKTYRLEMTIHPTTGQTLSTTATATVNGNAATIMDQTASYLNCYYEFTLPEAIEIEIDTIAATVTAPVAGDKPSAPTTSTANVSIAGYQWKMGGNPLAADATFEAGKTYRLEMTIHPTTGQTLSTTATATVNGNAATIMDQTASYLNCYYEFTLPEAITIDTIAATITPPVAGATRDLNLGLSAGAQICTSGNNNWFDMSNGTETGTVMTSTDTYIEGRTYRCRFTVESKPGYVFADPISAVTLNGNATTIFAQVGNIFVFDATFVATAPATEYDITVTDGTATIGAGTEISKAAEGTTVTLTANTAPTGKVFDKWVVESGSIIFTDANNEITSFIMPAENVNIKATYKDAPHTHSYGTDWKSDATNHWHECACGEKKDVAAHTFDAGKITKTATATEKGVKTYTCTVCGITKTETIPATGSSIPKAGTKLKDAAGKAVYKVTSADKTNPTVEYTAPVNKKAKSVTIPATIKVNGITYKVTSIARNAFKNNKKLTKITIGKNVVSIGAKAFYGCKKLKSITIKTTKLTSKKVGKQAFKGIYAKATIKVPKSKLKVYKKLLKSKGVGSKAKIKK